MEKALAMPGIISYFPDMPARYNEDSGMYLKRPLFHVRHGFSI
jgi:hypothetical protein